MRQLCSGVFGINDGKKDGSDHSKNDELVSRNSHTNVNDDNGNGSINGDTRAYGNAHNGETHPLNIPNHYITRPLITPSNNMIHPLTPHFQHNHFCLP